MNTLFDLVQRMESRTDRTVRVYDRRGRVAEARSQAALAARARVVGAELLAAGCAPGQHLFLQLPTSHALLETFLGAVLIGAVPCVLAQPRALGGIEAFRERLARLFSTFPGSRLIAAEDVGDESGLPYLLPPEPTDATKPVALATGSAGALAFIQLTSGSTHAPKAVRISHGAVCANAAAIQAASGTTAEHDAVGWLPMYHDMGLVGIFLGSLWIGCDLTLLRPETFLARPVTWLRAISEASGEAVSSAPNFAYRHCVDSIRESAVRELDLSRWRVALCGAEAVRASTLRAFTERFAPAGFRETSFVPCYGMAEATLAVTFTADDQPIRTHAGNVSCGPPVPETSVVIRGASGEALEEGEEGEITVRSPSLCDGYAGDGHPSPIRDGWLYTGDRGYLHDGELFITGRFKDLLIIDGVNVSPEELEHLADGVASTRAGRSAAFSIECGDRERAVLVAEVASAEDGQYAGWAEEMGRRVAGALGFRPREVVFVRRGTIPKTTSGKVRRSHLKQLYQSGELVTLWRTGQLPPGGRDGPIGKEA
jgi:acyl-CoA synthetase (AMP-forming)/AMP-acid ligase II